jgi:hypothetical protein
MLFNPADATSCIAVLSSILETPIRSIAIGEESRTRTQTEPEQDVCVERDCMNLML